VIAPARAGLVRVEQSRASAPTTSSPAATDRDRQWPLVAGAYAASRLLTLLVAALAAGVHHHRLGLTWKVLGSWDGFWYVRLAQHGYPAAVPAGVGAPAQTTLAFFPVYPVAVRLVATVLPVSTLTAALLVSWVLGGLACGAVWLVAREVLGPRGASRVALAFAFAPGAFVLSMAYSEGALLLAAALCLYGLLRQRWLLAGVCGALATAARPNGVAVLAACAVAVLPIVFRRAGRAAGSVSASDRSPALSGRRLGALWDLRPLAPLALAPAGVAAFFCFLWVRTGSPLTWFDAEARGWAQRTDFGATTLARIADFLRHGPVDREATMVVGCLVLAVVLGRRCWRQRQPAVLLAYSAAAVFLCFSGSSLSGRPRSLLVAFPLLFPVAQLPRRVFVAWLVVSAALMAALLWFAGTQNGIAP
jgi:hypothetical protein